jgi:putative transposase
MVRRRKPPSQTWRTFLANHMKDMVSSDFFVVPTVFFRVLFVFVILSHDRRRIAHVAVTEHPTSEWVAHQLLEAFPWDSAPRYLLRDRDRSYGEQFSQAAQWLGVREVLAAAQSPWQNAYVERLIGSIRRECLDHVIALNESSLRRILKSYFDYYERSRTHLSLTKDAPVARPIQPIGTGAIVAIPQVGGLHHRYERIAA